MRTDRHDGASSAPACVPTTAGGQLTPPMKVRDVRPRYKQAWIDAKLEGDVLLQARIGTDGTVRERRSRFRRCNAELEDEAIAAVSQWEFSPTYLNCEPIEVRMYVTVSFKARSVIVRACASTDGRRSMPWRRRLGDRRRFRLHLRALSS